MKLIVSLVVVMLIWASCADAQTRCTYRCAGRVCWVDCS